MDLKEIKQLMEDGGGKIIIVENDKPTIIVMSYEEYAQRSHAKPVFTEKKENELMSIPVQNEQNSEKELTIDDLPL